MTRLLLNLLTLASLLLCVAVAGLWVRSYRACDAFGHWYRHTQAEQIAGRRVERWYVNRFRGVESSQGMVGVGSWWWEQARRSRAVFAVEWEPAPDEDRVALKQMLREARPIEVPFGSAFARARGRGGFAFVDAPMWPGRGGLKAVVVPYWAVALAAAAGPAARALALARNRRARRLGLCPQCGYDLRATPGRCPECGSPTSVSTSG